MHLLQQHAVIRTLALKGKLDKSVLIEEPLVQLPRSFFGHSGNVDVNIDEEEPPQLMLVEEDDVSHAKNCHVNAVEATATRRVYRHNPYAAAVTPTVSLPVPNCPQAAVSASCPAPPLLRKTMCCYFKQKGYCKKGAKCWHGHEGDLYTPCHYGTDCKAGHATLVVMAELAAASTVGYFGSCSASRGSFFPSQCYAAPSSFDTEDVITDHC